MRAGRKSAGEQTKGGSVCWPGLLKGEERERAEITVLCVEVWVVAEGRKVKFPIVCAVDDVVNGGANEKEMKEEKKTIN